MGRAKLWATMLATVALLGACTSTAPGDASPTTTTTSAASEDELPSYGAPKVDNPLDLAHFLQAPCDILTDAESEDFLGSGIEPTSDVDAATGPDCSWAGDLNRASIGVNFPQLDDRGLTTVYHDRDEKYALFEELKPADGYPIVAYGGNDNRGKGECTVRVGTSDRDTVDINVQLSQDRIGQLDPCEAAHEVAVAVIGNIKARN